MPSVIRPGLPCIRFDTMRDDKELRWIGASYDDLLGFPDDVRRKAGFQLGKVQAGLDPDDWRPFGEVGRGAREIRLRDVAGVFRVIYVATFEEAIYVLHCFQKKTEVTAESDKDIAEARYRAIVRTRKATR